MVDHIAIAQRQSVSAERKRAGQVDSQQKRAQRQDERNAKRQGGGGLRTARGRRAPRSASQFHLTKKYSNRVGKNKAPTSALKKLAYDFRIALVDSQGKKVPPGTSKKDDLAYSYVAAAAGTPADALDLAKLAQEAQRTAGRQANSRQMSHTDIALPFELSDDGKRELVRAISDHTHTAMDGVPVFAAMHLPHDGNNNYHLHLSHPLRQIEAVGDDGAFRMTDRIMFEQRPAIREAAGLAKSNRDDLKAYRQDIANIIADALEAEGHDPQLIERWRHGHLTLAQQVEQAAKRGDVEFVIDNHSRSATRHEGPAAHHGQHQNEASKHNADTGIDAAILTRSMINQVLETAQRLGIGEPEHLRMLSRDMGLLLHWSKDRKANNVQGIQWQIINGPRLSGSAAGCSLGDLKRRMQWVEVPAHKLKTDRQGESFEAYKSILTAHGKGKFAGRGVSILDRILNAQIQEKEAAIIQAQTAAQVTTETETQTEAQPEQPPRQRPRRASSKDRSKDSLDSRKPTKEAPTVDANVIKKLMSDLSRLPDESVATPKAAPPLRLRPPTQAEIDSLTEAERQFLRNEYDYRVGAADFSTPAADAQERVERLWVELQRINDKEPLERDARFVEVKRLFRKPEIQESPALLQWREQQVKAQEAYETAYGRAASNFRKIYRDPELFAMLPAFKSEQSRLSQENERLAAEKHNNLIERNRERMAGEAYRAGERQTDNRTRDRGG